MLVVDRSLMPANGAIIIALVDGEFTVKTYRTGMKAAAASVSPRPSPPPPFLFHLKRLRTTQLSGFYTL